jgi:hypothetical protein
MKLAPGWWRLSVMIPMAVVIGIYVAIAVARPPYALWCLAGVVLLVAASWAVAIPVRLVITETTVEARQPSPGKHMPRDEVLVIRYFRRTISFRGPDDEPAMIIPSQWTLRQMMRVAEELQVPLYDHRRWRWLGMGAPRYRTARVRARIRYRGHCPSVGAARPGISARPRSTPEALRECRISSGA